MIQFRWSNSQGLILSGSRGVRFVKEGVVGVDRSG